MVLSGGRGHSPESWSSCCHNLLSYRVTRFLKTIIGLFGVCLGTLGTGMLAKISQAIKIPE